ncbi:Cytochrome P450 3A4 [Clarireedia jacksonii]
MRGCGIRIALGPLKFLYRNLKWYNACQTVHRYADYYVERALKYRQQYVKDKTPHDSKNQTLLESMAEQTGDREALRCQIIQAHITAQETTGNLLANVFFLLSRHERVWQKLREEVAAIGGSELDWDCISRLQYIGMVVNEVLRLYPILPHVNRAALKDTSLPTGGVPNGKSSIYIPKGTIFGTSSYALHRDTAVWFSDAAEFKPERWANNFKAGSGEFIPFGAGSRLFMGQQKALVESGYVIVRMAQELTSAQSRDDREWVGQLQITVKNAYGCLVSLKPTSGITQPHSNYTLNALGTCSKDRNLSRSRIKTYFFLSSTMEDL